MAFVYRYIDIDKNKVAYIGKVTGEAENNALTKRHKQHKSTDYWYGEHGGDENLMLQFIELPSAADADIYETILISKGDQEYLENRAKTGWGDVSFNLNIPEQDWIPYLWDGYEADRHVWDGKACSTESQWKLWKRLDYQFSRMNNDNFCDVCNRMKEIIEEQVERHTAISTHVNIIRERVATGDAPN